MSTASPEIEIEAVDVHTDHMIVTWSDTRHTARRKRSTSPVLSVAILYRRDGEEDSRYPPDGAVDAKQRKAVISEQFDTEATYQVWIEVYEDQLTFPSKIGQRVEATARNEKGRAIYTIRVCIYTMSSVYFNHTGVCIGDTIED